MFGEKLIAFTARAHACSRLASGSVSARGAGGSAATACPQGQQSRVTPTRAPQGSGGVLRARLFQLFPGAQSCSSSQAPAPSSIWRHSPRLLPAPLRRQQDPHRQLPPLWKLLEKVPSPVQPLAPVIPLLSRLPRHPALPKGHPGSCLVKLPIMKWHVHLMIKLLHREHERLRRTN